VPHGFAPPAPPQAVAEPVSLDAVYANATNGAPFTYDDACTYLVTSNKIDSVAKSTILDMKVKDQFKCCMIVKSYLDQGFVPHCPPPTQMMPPSSAYASIGGQQPLPAPTSPAQAQHYYHDPTTGLLVPVTAPRL
jgi:hypothetical protein